MSRVSQNWRKLAAADPGDLNVRAKLVDAYLALHRVGDAERVLTAAIKKNGIDQDALLRRSRIYLDTGKYSEAEADLNQVLHFRKDSAEAHYLLSKVAKARANPSMLRQELEEAVKIDPGFLMARVDLASTLVAEHSARFALQILDEAPREQQDAAALVLAAELGAAGSWGEGGSTQGNRPGTGDKQRFRRRFCRTRSSRWARRTTTGPGSRPKRRSQGTRRMFGRCSGSLQTYAAQKQTPAGIQKVREYAQTTAGLGRGSAVSRTDSSFQRRPRRSAQGR